MAGLLGRREHRERFELKVKHMGGGASNRKLQILWGLYYLIFIKRLTHPTYGLDTILPILQMGKQRLRKSLSNVPRLARGITWIAI